MKSPKKNILILGSAPDALDARDWTVHPFDDIVAINNAWKIRDDWSYSIFPTDFPEVRRPNHSIGKRLISADDYVVEQNKFGGFVYAGGTMAFTAAYWALAHFNPESLTFLGCDMIYDTENTHFYGKGTPDPLREDATLRNLEAKSARLEAFAFLLDCRLLNISKKEKSRLIFDRTSIDELNLLTPVDKKKFNLKNIFKTINLEKKLNYFVADGKYWKHFDRFDINQIDHIDNLWLSCRV